MRAVRNRFDQARAMSVVREAMQFYRVRGNAGYQAVLDEVEMRLAHADWPERDVRRLELGPERPTWRPIRAHLADEAGGELVGFSRESDPNRTALLIGSESSESAEYPVIGFEEAFANPALARSAVVRVESRSMLRRVAKVDVAGVLIHALRPFHEEHPDAIPFERLPDGIGFGFSLSRRAWSALGERVRVSIEVERGTSAASTLEARLRGTRPELPAIVLVAHVDEPGANDNASGVATLLEVMLALRELGPFERSVIALWGQEFESAEEWLERADTSPVGAALVLDMVGQDPLSVGAPFLIERAPDPGAIWTWPPDLPSSWGGSDVARDQLEPNFLSDLAAEAIRRERSRAPWDARTHPFEGGSDHQSFIERGVPALLAWHFPDDAYHTNRDTISRVSAQEMRRVGGLIGAITWTLARSDAAAHAILLAASERAARARFSSIVAQVEAARVDGPVAREALAAWARWYDAVCLRIAEWTRGEAGRTRDRIRERFELEARRISAYSHGERLQTTEAFDR